MSLTEMSELLGNFGEFAGAIAVVVTLVYLAAQVKLNKEATEANTRQMEENRKLTLAEHYMRRSERVERGYADGVLSPELSRVLFKVYKDPGALDEFERYQIREWSYAHMHQLDAQHYQYQHGLLEDEAVENLKRVLAEWGPIWKELDVTLPRASFRQEVDALMNNPPPDEGSTTNKSG